MCPTHRKSRCPELERYGNEPFESVPWALRSSPPMVPVGLGSWRDPVEGEERFRYRPWAWPVPAGFELRDGTFEALPGPAREFHPAEAPELWSLFGHLARSVDALHQTEDPPAAVTDEALAFVSSWGLTGPWVSRQAGGPVTPPTTQRVADLLRQAWVLRQVLIAWRIHRPANPGKKPGVDDVTMSPDVERIYDGLLPGYRPDYAASLLAAFLDEVAGLLPRPTAWGGSPYEDVGLGLVWRSPPSLFDVMRIEVAGELSSGEPLRDCPWCRRLFLRPQTRGGRRQRRVRPEALFCSPQHATNYALKFPKED